MNEKKYIPLALANEVPTGECRPFEIEGQAILLSNVGGSYFAIENTCTHDDGPLGSGKLEGTSIECPRHGARFDVRTGEVLRMPAAHPLKTYPIRIEGDRIFVEVEV